MGDRRVAPSVVQGKSCPNDLDEGASECFWLFIFPRSHRTGLLGAHGINSDVGLRLFHRFHSCTGDDGMMDPLQRCFEARGDFRVTGDFTGY